MFLVELITSSFLDLISKQARPESRCKCILVNSCFTLSLHFQECTDKIKPLLTKKSKFHFIQYLKQIAPCESGLIKGFRPGAQE